MSIGEIIAAKAYESAERDAKESKATRRALFHGVVFGIVVMIGAAIAATAAAKRSGIADAFEGGRMAKVVLPVMMEDVAEIKGALKVLIGQRSMVSYTQEQARACNQ
jgi:glucose uptake protein GlcU